MGVPDEAEADSRTGQGAGDEVSENDRLAQPIGQQAQHGGHHQSDADVLQRGGHILAILLVQWRSCNKPTTDLGHRGVSFGARAWRMIASYIGPDTAKRAAGLDVM